MIDKDGMSIASLIIHTGQELAQVCVMPGQKAITVNVPEQSINIWVAEENTEGAVIAKWGIWVPDKSGMRVLPAYSEAGTLTSYTSLGWALLDVTTALSRQYSNATKRPAGLCLFQSGIDTKTSYWEWQTKK